MTWALIISLEETLDTRYIPVPLGMEPFTSSYYIRLMS